MQLISLPNILDLPDLKYLLVNSIAVVAGAHTVGLEELIYRLPIGLGQEMVSSILGTSMYIKKDSTWDSC